MLCPLLSKKRSRALETNFMNFFTSSVDLKNEMYPIIYGGDAPNTREGFQSSDSK